MKKEDALSVISQLKTIDELRADRMVLEDKISDLIEEFMKKHRDGKIRVAVSAERGVREINGQIIDNDFVSVKVDIIL